MARIDQSALAAVGKWRITTLASAFAVFVAGADAQVRRETLVPFRAVFDPQQCEQAISFALAELRSHPHDPEARLLLGEAFLCHGLRGDVVALDSAIDALRPLVAQRPDHFFAVLALADALRRRSPLSDETERLLGHARHLVGRADVGAARESLSRYIEQSLGAVVERRRRAAPALASQTGAECRRDSRPNGVEPHEEDTR